MAKTFEEQRLISQLDERYLRSWLWTCRTGERPLGSNGGASEVIFSSRQMSFAV